MCPLMEFAIPSLVIGSGRVRGETRICDHPDANWCGRDCRSPDSDWPTQGPAMSQAMISWANSRDRLPTMTLQVFGRSR
jgi:hypothetical protein